MSKSMIGRVQLNCKLLKEGWSSLWPSSSLFWLGVSLKSSIVGFFLVVVMVAPMMEPSLVVSVLAVVS